MERIVLPMKVHAVKLEYRRLILNKIPHGYFCIRRGKKNVAITFDPDNSIYTPGRPRFLVVSSKLGKKYSEEITGYLRIKAEYDSLLNSWNATYSFAPPKVNFPIKQYYDPHFMNNEYFDNQKANLGHYTSDNPTFSEDGELKSKNELFAGELLHQMGIPIKYETEIYIEETDEKINPDYLISFYEIDRCAYLEVLGMNDKGDYSVRTSSKINSYSKAHYRPGREVIYIHMYDKHNFDSVYFVEQVLSAFDSLIPDSALEWNAGLRTIHVPLAGEKDIALPVNEQPASAC